MERGAKEGGEPGTERGGERVDRGRTKGTEEEEESKQRLRGER